MIQIDEAGSADIMRALIALVNDTYALREQAQRMAGALQEMRNEAQEGGAASVPQAEEGEEVDADS